jgi:hypothetical protein
LVDLIIYEVLYFYGVFLDGKRRQSVDHYLVFNLFKQLFKRDKWYLNERLDAFYAELILFRKILIFKSF